MEKRYQVFISSTFMDLEVARQEVSQALLRFGCFPAGMELFPAADEEQIEFIKRVIQQSDYYIVISAGRYGSIHPKTGLSYTEMEYDYAVKIGKPVVRLLHHDPKSIADENDAKLAKLLTFREKLSNDRLVKYWKAPGQLGLEVAEALRELKNSFPVAGWVPGSELLNVSDKYQNALLLEKKQNSLVSKKNTELRKLKESLQNLESDKVFRNFLRRVSYAIISSIFLFGLLLWGAKNSAQNELRNFKNEIRAVGESNKLLISILRNSDGDFQESAIKKIEISSSIGVNLRPIPSIESKKYKRIPFQTSCDVLHEFGRWYFSTCLVDDEINVGWLRNDHAKLVSRSTSPVSTPPRSAP